jgi:hypothetical protein
MILRICAAVVIVTVCAICCAMAAPGAGASPSALYAARLQDCISLTVDELPAMTAGAEQAAAKLAAGGKLWLAGDRGFVQEGLHRAGGTMAAQSLTALGRVAAGDVVLLGAVPPSLPQVAEVLKACKAVGALSVVFGPERPADECTLFVDTETARAGAEGLPVTHPAIAVGLWAFTGELVAALTRLGKMPPMYQSVLVPGGRERNAPHLQRQWDDPVAPIRPGLLGRTYLARMANALRSLIAREGAGLTSAGELAAQTLKRGATVWCEPVGHMPPEVAGGAGDPGLFKQLRLGQHPEKLPAMVKAGDLLLYVGYYEPFGPWVATAHDAGLKVVTAVSGTPEMAADATGADIAIDPQWTFGDALAEVPGYDIDILPPSGALAMAIYWMLEAETAAQM